MPSKGVVSAMLSLVAVAVVVLMGILPARQAWLVNAWSLQYTRQALNPVVKQSILTSPPAGHARAAFWLASTAFQAGNSALAETLIAAQVARGDPLAVHLMEDALLRDASQAQRAGRLEEALTAYEAAWRLDTESGTLPLVNFLLNIKKDYGTAENVLRQSLATFPNSWYWPYWSNRLGDTLQAQKRWDEATAAYDSTIVQAPDDWAAHIGLGWTRYERGDGLQAAISEFQKAINTPKSQGNGQLAIAQVLAREKQFKEADAWFAQALALNPEVQWWYVARGNVAQQAGSLRLALAAYQEALARFPDYAPAYYEIAYAYQLNKQSAQAIAAIEQALVLMAPPNADYYARAGNIYEGAGDASRALQAYRQALLIDPNNVAARKGMERLGK